MNSNPSSGFVAVTKSDTTVLENVRALYIGGAGDAYVQGADNTTVAFIGLTAGTILPVTAKRVMTATTATNIVALR